MAAGKIVPKSSRATALSQVLIDAGEKEDSLPIWFAKNGANVNAIPALTQAQRAWLESTDWKSRPGALALVPGKGGVLGGAVLGLGGGDAFSSLLPGALAARLPARTFHFASPPGDVNLASLAWALGAYRYGVYKSKADAKPPRLKLCQSADRTAIERIAEAVYFGRDLINRPANDLGPGELAAAARALAKRYRAKVSVTKGAALLEKKFSMIHAVGRASDREPCLIDMVWGKAGAIKVTLVGKGICFDTGGLNLKPGSSMALMKKDMGGAAAVLALAKMIMDAKLGVRLRVLIPAADNNVSANAFRPGDVLASRKGISVEIGNTDAEGRLLLADALSFADEEAPDYLISVATLTGAARVALGPDLPPLYCNDEAFATGVLASGARVADPLWRMPFWAPYDALLKSKVADLNHISSGPFAGSITAALFLRRFIERAQRYMHLDIYGWVPRAEPGRPEGGEPQGARALFEFFTETLG